MNQRQLTAKPAKSRNPSDVLPVREERRLSTTKWFGDFRWILSNFLITRGTDGEGISFLL